MGGTLDTTEALLEQIGTAILPMVLGDS